MDHGKSYFMDNVKFSFLDHGKVSLWTMLNLVSDHEKSFVNIADSIFNHGNF